jgi:hypothetical protein
VRAIGAASLFRTAAQPLLYFITSDAEQWSGHNPTLPRDAVPSAEDMLSIYLINGATAALVPGQFAAYVR